MKSLLLLDVDGALSPIPAERSQRPPYERLYPPGVEWTMISSAGGGVVVDARLPGWLATLRERYELVWATTWEEEAGSVLGPGLGLTDLPFIKFRDNPARLNGPGSRSNKLGPIADYIGKRPAAWVDDQITSGVRQWAKERRHPTMMIRTNKHQGITEGDVHRLLEWAAEV